MILSLLAICLFVVVIAAGAIEVGLRVLQLAIALRPRPAAAAAAMPAADLAGAFVSVHIPCCNEPPALVVASLDALARSESVRFEVIVIDNNTREPALWLPVAAACARLGARFRFIHVDRLAGAKAGALNVALAAADARTTHVAIVDADYQVDPGFLREAVTAAAAAGVDYVQFPQAYRAVGRAARGVECELGDYFACFAAGAGRPGSMLPTGTLSLFAIAALRAVGGWPTATITEDAEIGVRLQGAGYRGLWLARNAGRGLLPVDLAGIRGQRARWSAGNVQVLRGLRGALGRWPAAGDLGYVVAQLTAWVSLVLPAAAVLLLVALAPGLPLAGPLGTVAAATILLSLMLTAVRMVLVGGDAAAPAVRIEALATRLALTWTSATAWLAALWPAPLRFHRTPKSAAARGAAPLGEPAILAVSVAFLAAAVWHAQAGAVLPALACLVLAAVWPCGRFVDGALRRAAAANAAAVGRPAAAPGAGPEWA